MPTQKRVGTTKLRKPVHIRLLEPTDVSGNSVKGKLAYVGSGLNGIVLLGRPYFRRSQKFPRQTTRNLMAIKFFYGDVTNEVAKKYTDAFKKVGASFKRLGIRWMPEMMMYKLTKKDVRRMNKEFGDAIENVLSPVSSKLKSGTWVQLSPYFGNRRSRKLGEKDFEKLVHITWYLPNLVRHTQVVETKVKGFSKMTEVDEINRYLKEGGKSIVPAATLYHRTSPNARMEAVKILANLANMELMPSIDAISPIRVRGKTRRGWGSIIIDPDLFTGYCADVLGENGFSKKYASWAKEPEERIQELVCTISTISKTDKEKAQLISLACRHLDKANREVLIKYCGEHNLPLTHRERE